MDDILGNNDHILYSTLFNDPHPVYPLRKNHMMKMFLGTLKEFVTKKPIILYVKMSLKHFEITLLILFLYLPIFMMLCIEVLVIWMTLKKNC